MKLILCLAVTAAFASVPASATPITAAPPPPSSCCREVLVDWWGFAYSSLSEDGLMVIPHYRDVQMLELVGDCPVFTTYNPPVPPYTPPPTITIAPTPEPSFWWLVMAIFFVAVLVGRRK